MVEGIWTWYVRDDFGLVKNEGGAEKDDSKDKAVERVSLRPVSSGSTEHVRGEGVLDVADGGGFMSARHGGNDGDDEGDDEGRWLTRRGDAL